MITKALIMAIVLTESGGNPSALSSSNALGLMQLTPIGVLEVNQQYGITTQPNLRDPYVNVCYGILLLDYYYHRTGSIKTALITYNGGYVQLSRYRNGLQLTQETADYILRVFGTRARLNRMFDRELGSNNGIRAIVDDVWDDLYGTGEGGAGFLPAGGLRALRDPGGTDPVYCSIPL